MTEFYNDQNGKNIKGTSGNDTIDNYGSDVSISAGAGNDQIQNNGSNNVSISAGDGNDSITVAGGHNVTVSGGKGNDFVRHEWGAGTTYVYTGGNDTLEGFHNNTALVIADKWSSVRSDDSTVIISVKGKGTITLIEYESWKGNLEVVSSVSKATHYNLNWNGDNNTTFNGTSKDDFIHNDGYRVKINGAAGNDYIENNGDSVTIDGGVGDDFIGSWNDNGHASLNGGKGNDIIEIGSNYTTVFGGDGNDTIRAWGDENNNISINSGAGDDYIHSNVHKSTIDTGDGNDFIGSWGASFKVSINSGAGDDTISNGDISYDNNSGSFVTINAGDGNDLIDGNSGSDVKIFGGKGNDTIYSWYAGKKVTIDSGTGDDYIHNDSPNSSIKADSGNDDIYNYAENTFVDAGAGNDYIHMNEHMDWNEETQSWDYVSSPDNVTISGGAGDDTISNSRYGYRAGEKVSINAGSGDDYISNDGFNATIIGGKGNDTIYNSEAGMVYVYKSGDGNDYISGFGVLETLVVEGATYSTVKSNNDVLVKVGNDTITLSGAAQLANVNIVKSTKGIVPVNVVENETSNKTITGKSSSNWIRNFANKVTIKSGAGTDDIYNSGSNVVIRGGGGYDQIRSYADNVSIQGGSKADKIISGNGDNISIDAREGNDVIDVHWGVNLLVRGGKGNDSVNLNNDFGWNERYIFTYSKGDGNDIISKGAIINLIDGATINETVTSNSDTVLKIGNGSVTVKNTSPEEIIVVKDNKYSAYLIDVLRNDEPEKVIGKSSNTATQKIKNYGEKSTIVGGKGVDSIYNEASNSSINAGTGDDYIQTGDYNISNVTALGGAGNDTIYNNGKNASIDGGTGNDTIVSEGNSENVTINGGTGHDVIEVQGLDYLVRGGKGNDTVNLCFAKNNTEYVFEYAKDDGNDVLSKGAIISLVDGAKINQTLTSGNDTVLKIGTGSITVKDAKPSEIEIVTDGNYEKFFGYDEISNNTPGQVVKIQNHVHRKSKIQNEADKSSIYGGEAGNTTIDNRANDVLISLIGGNNYIYSYSTNGTIITGDGDDSVYTTNNDNDRNYINLGGGANYVYNNGTNTTIKSGSTKGDTIYTCPNSANNLIICGNGPNTLNINGANSTVNGGGKGDIIEFYADSGLVDGGADDDYVYKAGISYYDYEQALLDAAEKIRDASKAELEDLLYQFNADPNLKSIIRDGENSPVFEGVDPETAKKFADALRATKEFVEASLAYETDKSGNNFVNYLREKGLPYANEVAGYEETILDVGKEFYNQKMMDNLDALGDTFADPQKEKALIKATKNMEAFKKAGKVAGIVGNVLNATEKVTDLGTAYVSYSEKVDLYERRKQGIIENMTEENAAESIKQLEAINTARGQAGAELISSGLEVGVGTALEMAASGTGAVVGGAIGGVIGGAIGSAIPIAGTAVGAIVGRAIGSAVGAGVATYVTKGLIDKGTTAVKNAYLNRDHPYAGNIPTWKEITGQKTKSRNVQVDSSSKTLSLMKSSKKVVEVATVTLKGSKGNDALVNKGNLVLMIGGTGDDYIFNYGSKVTISGNNGNDIISNTGDNVSINGGDDNDAIENGGDDVTIETGNGNDYVASEGDDVTINALTGNNTINSYAGENISIVAGAGNDSIVNALGSNIKINAGDGDNIIENYGGTDVQINSGSGKDIVENYGEFVTINSNTGSDFIANHGANVKINSGTGNDLIVSEGSNITIDGGKGNDIIDLEDVADVVIKYNVSDGNDTIYGFNETSTLSISGGKYSTTKSGNDVIVTVGDGKITLAGAASLSSVNIKGTLSGGSSNSTLMTVTNSTKSPVTIAPDVKTVDASTRTTAVQITGNELANSIKGGSKNDTLTGGEGNDSLYGNAGNDKLYGQADDDKLYGGDGNDSLYGGIGNDTLSGGSGNDYLKGGDGNDTFIFSAGNDVIADFTAGQDKIKLSNASITSSTVSGDNVIFTLNSGKLTVTGGKDKDITIIDANGNESTKKYPTPRPSPKTLTVTKNATLGSSYQNADASKLTKAVQITGNALNNSIKGGSGNDSLSGLAGKDTLTGGNGKDTLTGGDGNDLLYGQAGDDKIYGQAGNDSLYGGSGNDSLWGGVGNDWLKGGLGNDWLKGGDGNDTFIYNNGDGKDTISGFDNGDLLQITGAFSTSYNSSKNEIYFKVGSTANAITITDFTATTFHVNNDTYQVSGSKFVKK